MRNFYGVSLAVAMALILAACGSEPNLIVSDAADATQPTEASTSAVANDSAPFEVIPNLGEFVESADVVNVDDHPLLRYMEPSTFDSRHPGTARFVLIDSDGEPARFGSAQFPLVVISINAYVSERAPFEYLLYYNNFNQNEFGEIGYGRCRGESGLFAQRSPTAYIYQPGRYPKVTNLGFDEDSMECGEMPPLTPASIFDGDVELEFDNTHITVVSQDGARWVFRQIPLRSERQRILDAQPPTTAAATTTSTITPVVEGN